MGRHACGPEPARGVRGEVDHHAMAVDAVHASALVQLAVLVNSLELGAHGAPLSDCRDMMAITAAPRSLAGSSPAGRSELGGELTYQLKKTVAPSR